MVKGKSYVLLIKLSYLDIQGGIFSRQIISPNTMSCFLGILFVEVGKIKYQKERNTSPFDVQVFFSFFVSNLKIYPSVFYCQLF